MFVERNIVADNIAAELVVFGQLRVGDSDRNLVVWLDAIGIVSAVAGHTVDYLDSKGPVPLVGTQHPAEH